MLKVFLRAETSVEVALQITTLNSKRVAITLFAADDRVKSVSVSCTLVAFVTSHSWRANASA